LDDARVASRVRPGRPDRHGAGWHAALLGVAGGGGVSRTRDRDACGGLPARRMRGDHRRGRAGAALPGRSGAGAACAARLHRRRARPPMKTALAFTLSWVLLVAMWLALNETLSPGQAVIGACVALAAVRMAIVLLDIVRSNVAVARVVVRPASRRGHAAFVGIPLELRDPVALAALGCIITSTPGTAWSGYDAASGILTLHVLDLIDANEMRRAIKNRYERRLMEIFA